MTEPESTNQEQAREKLVAAALRMGEATNVGIQKIDVKQIQLTVEAVLTAAAEYKRAAAYYPSHNDTSRLNKLQWLMTEGAKIKFKNPITVGFWYVGYGIFTTATLAGKARKTLREAIDDIPDLVNWKRHWSL